MAGNFNPSHRPTYLPRNWRLITVVGATSLGLACGLIQAVGADAPTFRKPKASTRSSATTKQTQPENGFVATIRRLMADSQACADKGDYSKAVQLADRAAKISDASSQLLGPSSECSPQETAKFAAEMRARQEAYAKGGKESAVATQVAQSTSATGVTAPPTKRNTVAAPQAPVSQAATPKPPIFRPPVSQPPVSQAPSRQPQVAQTKAPKVSVPQQPAKPVPSPSSADDRIVASTQTPAVTDVTESRANTARVTRQDPQIPASPGKNSNAAGIAGVSKIAAEKRPDDPLVSGQTRKITGAWSPTVASSGLGSASGGVVSRAEPDVARFGAGSHPNAWQSSATPIADVPPAPRWDDRPDSKSLAAAERLLDQSRKTAQAGDIDSAIQLAERALELAGPVTVFGPPQNSTLTEDATVLLTELDQRRDAAPSESVAVSEPVQTIPLSSAIEAIENESPDFEVPLRAQAPGKATIIRSTDRVEEPDIPPAPAESAESVPSRNPFEEVPIEVEQGPTQAISSDHGRRLTEWQPTKTENSSSAAWVTPTAPAADVVMQRAPLQFARKPLTQVGYESGPGLAEPLDEVVEPEPTNNTTAFDSKSSSVWNETPAESVAESRRIEANSTGPSKDVELTVARPVPSVDSTSIANIERSNTAVEPCRPPLRLRGKKVVLATEYTPLGNIESDEVDVAMPAEVASTNQERPTPQASNSSPENMKRPPLRRRRINTGHVEAMTAFESSEATDVKHAIDPIPTAQAMPADMNQPPTIVAAAAESMGESSFIQRTSFNSIETPTASAEAKPSTSIEAPAAESPAQSLLNQRGGGSTAPVEAPAASADAKRTASVVSAVGMAHAASTTPRAPMRLRGGRITQAVALESDDAGSQIRQASEWQVVPATPNVDRAPVGKQTSSEADPPRSVRPFSMKNPKPPIDPVAGDVSESKKETDVPVQRFPVQRVMQLQKRLESAAALNPGGFPDNVADRDATSHVANDVANEAGARQEVPNRKTVSIIKAQKSQQSETAKGEWHDAGRIPVKPAVAASPRPAGVKLRQRPGTRIPEDGAIHVGEATPVPKAPSTTPRQPVVAHSEFVGWKTIEANDSKAKPTTSQPSSSPSTKRGLVFEADRSDGRYESTEQSILPPPVSQVLFETSSERSGSINWEDPREIRRSPDLSAQDTTPAAESWHGHDAAPKLTLAPPPPEEKTLTLTWEPEESKRDESTTVDGAVRKSSFTLIDQVAAFFKLPIPTTISMIGCFAAALLGFGLTTLTAAFRVKHKS